MKKTNLSIALMMLCMTLISMGRTLAQDWTGWRGDGRGISPEKNLPLKWSEDEGVKWKTPIPGAGHSSPIVWGNRAFVTTGDPVWRTELNEGASWGTPFLFEAGGRSTIVTNVSRRMRGYDAATGKLLWECAGGSMISVPSPVAARGLVFLSSGHSLFPRRPIVAVRPEASGDITPPRGQSRSDGVAWSHRSGGAYVTSPIAIGEYLYVTLDKGSLTCYEAGTGKAVYEKQKLGDRNTITASPVAGDGKIYVQTEGGECYVVKPGPEFEILAVNKLDEVFCASPAVSAGKIFLRGRKHLYCIGK